jgi:hypothetical protein
MRAWAAHHRCCFCGNWSDGVFRLINNINTVVDVGRWSRCVLYLCVLGRLLLLCVGSISIAIIGFVGICSSSSIITVITSGVIILPPLYNHALLLLSNILLQFPLTPSRPSPLCPRFLLLPSAQSHPAPSCHARRRTRANRRRAVTIPLHHPLSCALAFIFNSRIPAAADDSPPPPPPTPVFLFVGQVFHVVLSCSALALLPITHTLVDIIAHTAAPATISATAACRHQAPLHRRFARIMYDSAQHTNVVSLHNQLMLLDL